jgi:peptide/nickel transport system permease protein
MLRFTLRETARLLSGLVGAALLATALAALTASSAWHGPAGFGAAFLDHLKAVANLDLGVSAVSGRAAIVDLANRLPATLILVSGGAVVALAIGGPLGILLGAGPFRRAAAPLIQIIAAAPVFCAALALSFVAQRLFHWTVGANGASLIDETTLKIDPSNLGGSLAPFLLPILTVGAAGAAAVQLALRRGSAMVARHPYRRGLRLLGLSALEIDRVYVWPEVFAVLVASIGEIVLALLSASAVAEWVFDVPGAAVLFVKSMALADWTMAALVLFVFAAIALIAEFIAVIASRALADAGVRP